MLNAIKDLIKQKQSFAESAEVIFEDALGNSLDDIIILGDESTYKESYNAFTEGEEDDTLEEPEDNMDEPTSLEDTPIDDEPIDGDENLPTEGEGESPYEIDRDPSPEDNLLNEPIGDEEEPMPLPGDDLPTPVGRQTGNVIELDEEDILSAEIDLKSNTLRDILPIPPANAIEAVPETDSILNQRIDSGFGESFDIFDESVEKEEAKKAASKLNKLRSSMFRDFRPALKSTIGELNASRGSLNNRIYPANYYVGIGAPDKLFGLLFRNTRIKKSLMNDNGNGKFFENLVFHVAVEFSLNSEPTDGVRKQLEKVAITAINKGLKKYIDDGIIKKRPNSFDEIDSGEESIMPDLKRNRFTEDFEYTDDSGFTHKAFFVSYGVMFNISREYVLGNSTAINESFFNAEAFDRAFYEEMDYYEAISLEDEGTDDNQSTEESEVTKEVKSKVDQAGGTTSDNSQIQTNNASPAPDADPGTPDGNSLMDEPIDELNDLEDMDNEPVGGGSVDASADVDILQKLSTASQGIEDVKQAILGKIQV